jgi:hypothetical protein
MDLSPGIRISPVRALERRAVAGLGSAAEWDMGKVDRRESWCFRSSWWALAFLTQLAGSVISQMYSLTEQQSLVVLALTNALNCVYGTRNPFDERWHKRLDDGIPNAGAARRRGITW